MLKPLVLILCLHPIACAAAQAADCGSDNLNQRELNACAGAGFDKADAELNARYKQIVACLKDAAKPLVEAQRAWIKFRDAECRFQGSATEGGSIQPTIVADCLKTVTAHRSKALNYYLTCEEGDLSCPTVTCGFPKAPKDKAPKDKAPKDKAPKDKAPKDKAPKDKAPKDKAPKDKAPKDKAPR